MPIAFCNQTRPAAPRLHVKSPGDFCHEKRKVWFSTGNCTGIDPWSRGPRGCLQRSGLAVSSLSRASSNDDDLPDYPLTSDDRLDSHYFMVWERRRWLNSDMRLKGTPECRALYSDLTNIAYDHSPVGTLPDDMEALPV